jgi:hypothetical protein
MQEKKTRILRIGIDADTIARLGQIKLSADGSIELLDHQGEALAASTFSSGIAYPRTKGPKLAVEVFYHEGSAGMVPVLLTEFDRIFGVDTNSRVQGEDRIYTSAVVELTDFSLRDTQWSCRFEPLWSWEFRGPKGDPEKIGWRDALLSFQELSWLKEAKCLLVVDSHLGELRSIARRTTPVLADYFLPENVWLAYASSDTATDSPLNSLMARCDRIAARLLGLAIDDPSALEPDLVPLEGQPFRLCRRWDWTANH